MGKSNMNLVVTFTSTADTRRESALRIAERVRTFLAVELESPDVRVEVHGATLDYREAWERERDAFEARRTDTLN